ncbi:MAG TPA: N-acetylmuramoyl-L-alanine amidase [Solirubrobacter sp.]|nr:N-acetylmuramoyl-L-alanine amidase [Solirubrobacter sp.]
MPQSPVLRRVIAALLTLAAVVAGVQLIDDDGDGRTDRVVVPVPRVIHDTTGHELPPSAPAPAAVDDRNDQAVAAGTYDTSRVLEGATAQGAQRSCPTPMHGAARSYSDIGLMVAHITVSPNRPGLADGQGLCDFFRRVKASPTWTVDNEGHSWENVPLTLTPWTQAWFNRQSCSIEYIGYTGRPGEGAASWTDAQLKEGGRLFAQCAKLAGIPVRSGKVTGSRIIRTGLITHQELGALGGGHTDPGPHWDRARQLYWIRYFAGGVSDTDRITCRKLNWWRTHGRPHGTPERNAVRRRHALTARGVTCTARGPVRS